MKVSETNRTIAKVLAEAFGGKPTVARFWDDNRKSAVDILSCCDRPQKAVTSFATIGLSDTPLCRDGKEYPVRAELVGACGSRFKGFDNALATAAFCVINSGWFCYPGAIFPDALAPYGYADSLPHFFFTGPFLWENELRTLKLDDKTVAWLLAIPISEKERVFATTHDADGLEKLFEKNQIDVFNLRRPSVV